MVDLSNLQLVAEDITGVADESTYVDGRDFPAPPPEGVYTLIQGKPEPKVTRKGQLGLKFDHMISGGEFDGQKLMFDEVSEAKFARDGVAGMSTMKDQIRAVYPQGAVERSARTREEMASAIEAAEGKPFKAAVQWDGYCGHKDTEFAADGTNPKDGVSVKYQKNFPGGGDAKCSVCGAAIRPRAKVNRRIANA